MSGTRRTGAVAASIICSVGLASLTGCQGYNAVTPPAQPAPVGLRLTQNTIWTPPARPDSVFAAKQTDGAGHRYTQPYSVLNQFAASGARLWSYPADLARTTDRVCSFEVEGRQLRTIVRQTDDFEPYQDHFFLTALDETGHEQWRVPLKDEVDYYRNPQCLAASEDGWSFVLLTIPDKWIGYVSAFDPTGHNAWNLHVPLKPGSSGYSALYLAAADQLVALRDGSSVDRITRAGAVVSHVELPPGEWAEFVAADPQNIYLRSPAYLPAFEPWAGKPDYFTTGRIPGGGSALALIKQDQVAWTAATELKLDCCVPRIGGGLLLGGDAGETAALDDTGHELWRVMPDQQREFDLAWQAIESYPLYQRFPDGAIGVSALTALPDGGAAISTNTGLLYRVDGAGHTVWSRPRLTGAPREPAGYGIDLEQYPAPGSHGTDALVVNADGDLACASGLTVALATGEIVSGPGPSSVGYYVYAQDGTIRCCGDFTCTALSANGDLLWQIALPDTVSALPACDSQGMLIVPTALGRLIGVSASGQQRWVAALPARDESQPVIAGDGNIYVVDILGNLTSLTTDGALRWTLPGMNSTNVRPAAGPDGVAVVTAQGTLSYVLSSSAIKWAYAFDGKPLTAPAAVDATGCTFFGGTSGYPAFAGMAVGLNADGSTMFTSVKDFTTFTAPPVILPDGSVLFHFDDFPDHGDVLPIRLESVVRQLDRTGQVLLSLPAQDKRWGNGPDVSLAATGLINGEYGAVFSASLWLIGTAGELQRITPGDLGRDLQVGPAGVLGLTADRLSLQQTRITIY